MKPIQIFETVLYAEDLDAAIDFYTRVMGLQLVTRMTDRGLSFRCADSVLLVFDPRKTKIRDHEVPAHGCSGEGHVAFLADPVDLDAWRAKLKSCGVAIETEVDWPQSGMSIYFRDPAGNSVEIAPPTLWGFNGLRNGRFISNVPPAPASLVDPAKTETLHVFGHQFWIRLSAKATGGALGVFEQYSLPGTAVPPHYHEYEEETFYVISGQAEFLMDGKPRLAGPGTTLFVPRKAVHGLKVHGNEPLRLHLTLTPGGSEEMFRELAALGSAPDQAKANAICKSYGCIFV